MRQETSTAVPGSVCSRRDLLPAAGAILNYNPQMRYRPLGRTGLMVSEISLGGHWRTADGKRYCDEFADEDVPAAVVRDRAGVVGACLDAGVNYIDVTTQAECLAYGLALRGRRDRVLIGADDFRLGLRNLDDCTVRLLTRDVEECLRRLRTEYLDLWRVTTDMKERNTDGHIETMLDAADVLRRAGKIRHVGLASHVPEWLARIVGLYGDRLDAVVFPCTPMTRRREGGDSLFEVVGRRKLGLIAIKPFAGGNIFSSAAPSNVDADQFHDDDLAAWALRLILARHEEISCAVPGLTTVGEVASAVRAVSPVDSAGREGMRPEVERCAREWPAEYEWLRRWDAV